MSEETPQHSVSTPDTTLRTTLLTLLSSDYHVQQAIRHLCSPPDSTAPAAHEQQGFGPERELLDLISMDAALKHTWLNREEPVERQLVRLIAIASQWDRLLLLWDDLAARCKNEQRDALESEESILEHCLSLHNLIWQERQASLHTVVVGTSFDPLSHQRGTLHGDTIRAQWLPGLRNAAGQLQRKPLVRT